MKNTTLGAKIINSTLSVALTVGLMPSPAWAENGEEGVSLQPAEAAASEEVVSPEPTGDLASEEAETAAPYEDAASEEVVSIESAEDAASDEGVSSEPAEDAAIEEAVSPAPAEDAVSDEVASPELAEIVMVTLDDEGSTSQPVNAQQDPIDLLGDAEGSGNTLTLDEAFTVTVASAGEEVLLSFTAPEEGSYTFASSGELDTVGYLYPDQTKTVILDDDDDNGVDSNFKICWTMDSAETVYLLVYLYGNSTGTFDVTVTQGSDEPDSNTIREGEWIFDANYSSYIDAQGVLHQEYRLQRVGGSVCLTEGTDYTVAISQNGTPITGTPTQPGVYEYTATGIGNYSGSITNYLSISNYDDLAAASYNVPSEFSYTGNAIDTSKIVVTDALGNTVDSSNYELIFVNDEVSS